MANTITNTTEKSANAKSMTASGTGNSGIAPAVFPELEVSGDGMLAKLRFPLRYANSLAATVTWLKEQGVIWGVDEKALANAVAMAAKSTKPWTADIAHGRSPVEARDGHIEYLFKCGSSADAVADDKKIDYRETGKIVPVNGNQTLAVLHAPMDGTPGTTVTGREIQPKKRRGSMPRFNTGANVRQEDNRVIATATGMVEKTATGIQVLTELTINGDVDYTTGNIHFPGPVTIRGSITPGFIVEAAGNVVITGVVEDAIINAAGNLTIQQGCVGENKTEIFCQGNISTSFIENSRIESGGDITVKSHIMHSQVYAAGHVHVSSGKGLIVGGTVYAVRGIDARILGSDSVIKTHIAITESRKITEKLDRITAQIDQAEQNTQKIQRAVGEEKMAVIAAHPEQVDTAHYGHLAPVLKKLSNEYTTLQAQAEALKKEHEAIINENAKVEKGVIRVAANVFQGVFIGIAHLGMEITEDMSGGTFSADIPAGEIKIQ